LANAVRRLSLPDADFEREASRWLAVFAVAALIVGNGLRGRGLEASRANEYGSAASLAGQRASGRGKINIAGGACFVTAVWILL